MELREPESEMLRRAVTVGIVLLAAITAAFLYLRISGWRGTLDCGAAYATAYTGMDSANVDLQASGACGELRSSGELR